MSITPHNIFTISHSHIKSFYFKNPKKSNPLILKPLKNPLIFPTQKPHLSKIEFLQCKAKAFNSVNGQNSAEYEYEFDFDGLLAALEFLCLLSSAVVGICYVVNSWFLGSMKWLGNRVLAVQCAVLVSGVIIGSVIRRRQWRRICMSNYSKYGSGGDGLKGINLLERIEKVEEDLRSSATIIRVLSRQLEKLGIRFRVTRKTLKDPITETATLAQKNSEATRALALQGERLEKELGEIQKVLLAMQFSHPFFEEVLQCTSEQGAGLANTDPLDCGDKIIPDPSKMESEDMPMIGLDAMQRANSTLEDFCRSYFMFHKMDPHQPQSMFRYLPILSFTESYIYQLDYLNEKLLQPSMGKDRSSYRESSVEAKQSWELTSVRMMTNDPFRPLCILLQQHGLLTDRVREEFCSGVEYWSLERKLCHALGSKQEISVEDVMRAIHLKSFDYRVLNLLLYQLRGEKVNDMHMDFLSTSEFLVEDDVLENSFNILRMFNGIYGASAAPPMLAKVITEAEEKYDSLLKVLDPELSRSYQKRFEEATKERGKTSGPSLGTWSIPPVIEDEDLYRSDVLNSKPSTIPECNT